MRIKEEKIYLINRLNYEGIWLCQKVVLIDSFSDITNHVSITHFHCGIFSIFGGQEYSQHLILLDYIYILKKISLILI